MATQVAVRSPGQDLDQLLVRALGDTYRVEPVLARPGAPLALATRSHVVDPPFFADGDIGRLAVCGAVNELAVSGVRPEAVTLSLILEAGLPLGRLRHLAESAAAAARESGVRIVAVDTCVVRAGEADQVYVVTTALGTKHAGTPPSPPHPGARVLLSGELGSYAAHLLSSREGLGFEVFVSSRCAPLNGLLDTVRGALPPGAVHVVLRPASGGLDAALRAFAADHGLTARLQRADLPVSFEAHLTFDTLGLDPLRMEDESCLCLVVAEESAEAALAALRSHPHGQGAVEIGLLVPGTGQAVEWFREEGGPNPSPSPSPARLR